MFTEIKKNNLNEMKKKTIHTVKIKYVCSVYFVFTIFKECRRKKDFLEKTQIKC